MSLPAVGRNIYLNPGFVLILTHQHFKGFHNQHVLTLWLNGSCQLDRLRVSATLENMTYILGMSLSTNLAFFRTLLNKTKLG